MGDDREVSKVYVDSNGNSHNIIGPDGHKDGPHDHVIVNDQGQVTTQVIRTDDD